MKPASNEVADFGIKKFLSLVALAFNELQKWDKQVKVVVAVRFIYVLLLLSIL